MIIACGFWVCFRACCFGVWCLFTLFGFALGWFWVGVIWLLCLHILIGFYCLCGLLIFLKLVLGVIGLIGCMLWVYLWVFAGFVIRALYYDDLVLIHFFDCFRYYFVCYWGV